MSNLVYAGKVRGRQYPVNEVFNALQILGARLTVYTNDKYWLESANLKWSNTHFVAKEYVDKEELDKIYKEADGFIVIVGSECNSFSFIVPSKLSELAPLNKPVIVFGPKNSEIFDLAAKWNLATFIDIDNVDVSLLRQYLRLVDNGDFKEINNNYKELFPSRKEIAQRFENIINQVNV